MPKHPKEPHLFAVTIDGELTRVVRAASHAEARDYMLGEHIAIVRLSPSEAYRAGMLGAPLSNAKPEYEPDQADLFRQEADTIGSAVFSSASEVQHVEPGA